MTKRMGVTGASGRVGKILVEKYGAIPLDCDVTLPDEVEKAIGVAKPDIVVHLAAITDVDYCEKNQKVAMKVNFNGTNNVVMSVLRHNIGMVILSSDHVFDGKKGNYKEDYRFIDFGLFGKKYHNPVSYYGLTKLACEGYKFNKNVKVVRTSYLFDKERLKLEKDYPTFIYRSFMYLPHFVESLATYTDRFDEMSPILHLSGSKIVSWYEFAKIALGTPAWIKPRSKELDGFAPRPFRGGLNIDLSKRLGFKQYSYMDGAKEMSG